MWKSIPLTCIGLFLVIVESNGISGFDEDIEGQPQNIFRRARILFKQEKGRDISNLETNEPGFNFTDAEMEKLRIWPGGVIPYYVDTLSFDVEYRKRLDYFFDSVSNVVGVQFLKLQRPPKDEGSRWVFIVNRRGLLSSGGYTTKDFTTKGVQKVILGYDSPYNGELFETTLAILGVPPQHNAPNRDKYIKVKYDNIMPNKKQMFDVLKDDEWLFHEVEYDFLSAGHYGLHKYSIGGYATIDPKRKIVDGIGDGQGFSFTDIWKIRMLYNYISKSRSSIIKKSDCQKMFKPGPKFNAFAPKEPFGQGPRPKPNKYLGKPVDNHDEPSSTSLESNFEPENQKLKGKRRPKPPPRPTTAKTTTRRTTTTKKRKRTKDTDSSLDLSLDIEVKIRDEETSYES